MIFHCNGVLGTNNWFPMRTGCEQHTQYPSTLPEPSHAYQTLSGEQIARYYVQIYYTPAEGCSLRIQPQGPVGPKVIFSVAEMDEKMDRWTTGLKGIR